MVFFEIHLPDLWKNKFRNVVRTVRNFYIGQASESQKTPLAECEGIEWRVLES